jgi:DNA polymerase gamma 1
MTCLTPSHEEKISEGVSCTLLDTINELSKGKEEQKECLLGNSIETNGIHVNQETIFDLTKKIYLKDNTKGCDLPFLKAQMYKNYKSHIDPSFSGNRATEKVVKNR